MRHIPPRPSGSNRFAVFVQSVWDYIWGQESIFVDTPEGELKFEKIPGGKYLPVLDRSRGGGKRGTKIKLYELQSIADDVLLCYEVSIADDLTRTRGTDYKFIAKPPELRNPLIGGSETISGELINYEWVDETTRIASLDSDPLITETQVVVPYYLPVSEENLIGSLIFGAHMPEGTGAVVDIVDVGETTVTIQDINVAGRAWALKNEEA